MSTEGTERRGPVEDWWILKAGLVLLAACFGSVAIGIGLTACGSDAAASGPANADQRTGWIRVFDGPYSGTGVYKRCDGATLLYYVNDGVSAAPHADECLP